jgi:SAM-dependent methyltransferase
MATMLRQKNVRTAAPERKALTAWLAPRLTYAGRLYMMERKREAELMDDDAQARAYAEADFNESHNMFVDLFAKRFGGADVSGFVLDLGCGTGDISFRFARAYPKCTVHGVEGSEAMLRYGRKLLKQQADLADRVELIQGYFPGAKLPREDYDVIISNSMLHHLADPYVLWREIENRGRSGAMVFIMDLRRPTSPASARRLVDRHAGREPAILRRDYYNSLLAAFRVEDIRKQLDRAGLKDFEVQEVGDRHVTISGSAP